MELERGLASDLRLSEQLLAMRHLRPGTQLMSPQGRLARQLRDDYLQIAEERDPLRWLSEERGQLSALLALALTLDLANTLRRTERQLNRTDRNLGPLEAPSAWETTLLGQMLTPGGLPAESAVWADSVTDLADTDALVDALVRLRRACAVAAETAPRLSWAEPARLTLLADLLRLPDAIDPLVWLRDERTALGVRLVLEHLVRQSLPDEARAMITRQPLLRPSVRLRAHTHLGRELSVHVDRVDFHKFGFVIHLRAGFRASGMRPADPRPDTFVTWEGFDRVVDDRGYRYVVQVADRQMARQPWPWRGRWRERLTLACWPALENPHHLTLQSLPAMLTPYRALSFGQELIPNSSPVLGDLTIHAVVTG